MRASRWKRVLLVAATALLAFTGLGAWAIASPVGAAPDDDYHLASIWCSWGEREDLCADGYEPGQRLVSERLVYSSGCFAHAPESSAQCPLDDEVMTLTTRGNFSGSYPPVFYGTMGIFAGPDVAVSTVLMRLFNAALFVGAVTAVLLLLRPGQRGPLVWSAVATLVPLGVFIIPSTNPSSWAVLAGLTVWLAVYGYYTAESRGRRIALAAIAVVLAIMGAGARGDSAVYVAFAALAAAILAFNKDRAWLRLSALPLAIIVIGAVFYLSSGQATGAASVGTGAAAGSSEVTAEVAQTAASTRLSDIPVNLLYLPYLWTGGTGTWGLGWLDTPVPPTVWIVMIGAIFALLLWGLQRVTARKGIVLALALLGLTAIPLYVLYGMGMRVGAEVQPRYLLPLFITFVGVALYGFAWDGIGLSRLQTGLLFAGVAVANALALQANMRRYITGVGDGGGFNLDSGIEWWWATPVQPMTVWLLGSAAFALMLAGLFLLLHPKGERKVVVGN